MFNETSPTRYSVIEEREVFEMSRQPELNQDNSFKYALHIGHMYKMAGLTPLYMVDLEDNHILITTEERQNNKLH